MSDLLDLPTGVWVSYAPNNNDKVFWQKEIDALRHAVKHGWDVKFYTFETVYYLKET